MGLYHEEVSNEWILTYNRKRQSPDQPLAALNTETEVYYEANNIEGIQRPIEVLNRQIDYRERVPDRDEAEIRELTDGGIELLTENLLEQD